MEDRGIFAGLETGKDLLFFEVGFGEDQVVCLVAVSGDYDMVIDILFPVL